MAKTSLYSKQDKINKLRFLTVSILKKAIHLLKSWVFEFFFWKNIGTWVLEINCLLQFKFVIYSSVQDLRQPDDEDVECNTVDDNTMQKNILNTMDIFIKAWLRWNHFKKTYKRTSSTQWTSSSRPGSGEFTLKKLIEEHPQHNGHLHQGLAQVNPLKKHL